MQKCGGWGQEFVPSSPGGRVGITRYLGSSLQTLPLKDHPSCSHFPLWGLGSSGALGILKEEGPGWPGAGCTDSRARACTPFSHRRVTHPVTPLLLSVPLCLVPRAGSGPSEGCRQSGLYASGGACIPSPTVTMFCPLGCCTGTEWDASERRGDAV